MAEIHSPRRIRKGEKPFWYFYSHIEPISKIYLPGQAETAVEWIPNFLQFACAEPSFSLLTALPVHSQYRPTFWGSRCPHLIENSGVLGTNFLAPASPSPKPHSWIPLSTRMFTPSFFIWCLISMHPHILIMSMTNYYRRIIAQRIRAGTVGVFGEQPSVPRPDPSWLVSTVYPRLFLLISSCNKIQTPGDVCRGK